MNMKEYSKGKYGEPYHPDDTPRFYLTEHTVEAALKPLASQCASDKDRDTIEFIRFHESIHRELAEGRIVPAEHKQRIDMRAEYFRQKHGDWVHHANPLYWQFYESL
jgi:hypothetical protein